VTKKINGSVINRQVCVFITKRVLRSVASSPALHYFILETFETQWSKLNIIISCPIVTECKNNLEILSDTKNKWFSYQSASLCVHNKNTLINHEENKLKNPHPLIPVM
jgi:hypothetical protein